MLDNLNTHTGPSSYEAFPADEARRLLDCLEIHHTPKHASWLNMAEIEIGVLQSQCLNRRLDNAEWLRSEIRAWEERRNKQQVKIHWSFTIAVARHKPHSSWVGARRVTLRHVFSRPPFSTVRAASTESAAAPAVLLHAYHRSSVSISVASTDVHPCLIPFRQPSLTVWRGHSLRVRWVLCSPLTFVLHTPPG